MKAAILRRGCEVAVVEMDEPRASEGEIIVRMVASGLCGTDLEKIKGEYTGSPPVIGHEVAGVVEEVGEGVEGISKGEAVVPHHHVACGECYYCKSGSQTMCPYYRKYNFEPGGFAELFRVPAWNVYHGGIHRIPEGLDFEEACLAEPTACCIRGIRRIGFRSGESVLIVGSGPIGLTFIQLLKHAEASSIIAVDISEVRLRYAEKLGADVALDARSKGLVEEIKKITGGRGVDVSIVSSSSMAALTLALRVIRSGGRMCLFGIPPVGSRLDYDFSELLIRELSIISSNAATEVEIDEALRALSFKVVDARSMITHRYNIESFNEAVKAAASASCVKAIITP